MAHTPSLAPPVATKPGDDPTALTTQLALREDQHLLLLMEAKIAGLTSTIGTRLDGMDKALTRAEAIANKVPSDIDIAIKRVEQLMNERLMGHEKLVDARFEERDQRAADASAAEVRRVDAAFSAQKESVQKTEANFAELINQGRETQIQAKASLEALLNELKSRIDRGEGVQKGATDLRGVYMGIAALAVSIIVAMLAIGNTFRLAS